MAIIEEVSANLRQLGNLSGRVFHGRGGFFEALEHLTIDWYPPCLLVQTYTNSLEPAVIEDLKNLFERHLNIEAILLQSRDHSEIQTVVLVQRQAELVMPVSLTASLGHGVQCDVVLGKNRNTGVFLDMKNGWNWVRDKAKGKRILNLFSYTGVFSLFALSGGAARVDNVDMAANVQKISQRNHQSNQVEPGSAAFFKYNIMKSLKKISRMGPYDLIIIDPPPYQKNAFQGWTDYQKLLSTCHTSLAPKGIIFACLNHPQISRQQFENDLKQILPDVDHIEQIASGPEIKEIDFNKGLKTSAVYFS